MNSEFVYLITAVLMVAALVITGYYLVQTVKEFIINEQKKTLLEIQKIGETEARKVITPLQIQSYERLVLFLERIKPDNLVLRCWQPGMNAQLLRDVMVKNIRDEYEHNLSQQLYVSEQAWVYIRNAKEEIINTLNSLNPKDNNETSPTSFAGQLFEKTAEGQNQTELAQDFLKKELQERFK